MVIGGATVYAEFADRCDRIDLTLVEGDFEGTVHFPRERFRGSHWKVSRDETCPADDKNPHAHRFVVLERERSDGTGSFPAGLPFGDA